MQTFSLNLRQAAERLLVAGSVHARVRCGTAQNLRHHKYLGVVLRDQETSQKLVLVARNRQNHLLH